MALIKRELTRCSREAAPESIVSVWYDDLTGAMGSVEVTTQAEAVRVKLTHLVQPLLNQELVFLANATTRVSVPVGYIFLPTALKTLGGTLQTASIICSWPS
jgi:hypothetical protein